VSPSASLHPPTVAPPPAPRQMALVVRLRSTVPKERATGGWVKTNLCELRWTTVGLRRKEFRTWEPSGSFYTTGRKPVS